MKSKLLIGYLVVIASLYLPTDLNKPHDDGALHLKEVAHAETLKEFPVQKFDNLDKVPVSVEDIAYSIAAKKGWTGSEWQALKHLWGNESGWNTQAVNRTSGACGIPQAWPCSKIGPDWRDPKTQLTWGANYIAERYGSPSKALGFWYAQCGSSKGCWY